MVSCRATALRTVQHAHVVGRGAGNVAILGKRGSTNEISAADDNRQLHAQLRHFDALARDGFQFRRFDAKGSLVAKSFAADFQ
jgi:hypothetical protein